MNVAAVVAHAGGWDETLLVLAPLALFTILLVMARRRVDRRDNTAPGADGAVDASSGDEPDGAAVGQDAEH